MRRAARGSAGSIVFGESMISLTLRFAAAVGRTLGPGDEVVVTRLDHDGNGRPGAIAAERAGATVRSQSPTARRSSWRPEHVAAAVTESTRSIAFTAMFRSRCRRR